MHKWGEQPQKSILKIGLSLEEVKTVLRQVQARIIQTQVDALGAAYRQCVGCGRKRMKDLRTPPVCALSEYSPVAWGCLSELTNKWDVVGIRFFGILIQ